MLGIDDVKAWWNRKPTAGSRLNALCMSLTVSCGCLAMAFFVLLQLLVGDKNAFWPAALLFTAIGVFFGLASDRIEGKLWDQLRAEGWEGE